MDKMRSQNNRTIYNGPATCEYQGEFKNVEHYGRLSLTGTGTYYFPSPSVQLTRTKNTVVVIVVNCRVSFDGENASQMMVSKFCSRKGKRYERTMFVKKILSVLPVVGASSNVYCDHAHLQLSERGGYSERTLPHRVGLPGMPAATVTYEKSLRPSHPHR